MEDEIENRERRSIPQEKYDLVLWTKYEKLFRKREKLRNKVLSEISVPFTIALQVKLRRSLLGTYLKYFNENQWQNEFLNNNKLTITNSIIKEFNKSKREMFEYNNNLFDHMRQYLKNTITETDEIDCSYLYQHATFLRLDDYHINSLDDGFRHFINLQVLVLCDNWISDIEGYFLPRRLKYLELYVNDIKSLNKLTEKAPKGLVYLGLGRNKLTNDSSLHLLVKSERFQKLTVLDLSENDIYSLVDILAELEGLRELESLQLQGNPCSTVTGYKDIVLQTFPFLIFLDGLEILKADRNSPEIFLNGANDAEFFFSCVKLGGTQKPPKCEKKLKQSIHIEITMPLFQEDTITEVKNVNLQDNIKEKSSKKSGKEKPKKNKKNKKKKGGKVSKENVYNREDEYNPKIKNNAFATARKQWAKVLHYPAIKLKSPENNLLTYRDSCRSSVNVQLPEKKKKGKKGKKDKRDKKKKKKKDEKSTKSSKSSKKKKGKTNSESSKSSKKKKGKTHSETTTNESSAADVKPEELDKKVEPQEKILKRITLANFNCDLFSIDWKDSFIEFYWSEDPEFGNKAVEYESYLQDLAEQEEEKKRAKLLELEKIKEKKSKTGKKSKKSGKDKSSKSKKSKKSKSSSKSKKSSKKSKKTKSSKSSSKKGSKKSKKSKKDDKYMTCQVRFGLSRIGNIIEDDVKEDKVNKKAKKGKKGKKGSKNKTAAL